jgi:hypothetical protein
MEIRCSLNPFLFSLFLLLFEVHAPMVTCGGVCKVPTRRPLGTHICCCLFSLHSFERQSTDYSVYRRPTRLSTNNQPYNMGQKICVTPGLELGNYRSSDRNLVTWNLWSEPYSILGNSMLGGHNHSLPGRIQAGSGGSCTGIENE